MARKGKYIIMLGLVVLTFVTAASQTETIVGKKNNGNPIKANSVIGYTDSCTFFLYPFHSSDVKECSWYIDIYQRRPDDKSAVKYAESTVNNLYTFSFSQLFQERGWPQKDEGYFWDTDAETGLVYADIICETVNEDSLTAKFSLPVYLNLAPEKPILNILKMQEMEPGNYDISVEVHLPPTSAPIQGKWKIKVVEGWIINYYFDEIFSFDNAYFENEGDGFIIKGQNDFGSTETDFIDPRTYYLSVETSNINSKLVVFPNPVKDKLYLYTKEAEDYISDIIVYDSVGKRIKQVVIPIRQTTAIDIYTLPPGQYFLQVKEKSGRKYILRFIKIV